MTILFALLISQAFADPPKETQILTGIAQIAKDACAAMKPAPPNCEARLREDIQKMRKEIPDKKK